MNPYQAYNGGLTAEQFLFYEIRIAVGFYLDGKSVDEAIAVVRKENLFQYPTERQVSRITRACYKRLNALNNEQLVRELAYAPRDIARQINLYAMMKYNRLVWDFMISVIGEKYRTLDLNFSRGDLNAFFSRLQAQNDTVASWSETTIQKIKGVFVRSLVETEHLDNFRSTRLNTILLSEELERGIKENGDFAALPAFNYLR